MAAKRFATAVVLSLVASLLLAPISARSGGVAHAEVTGPCSATINGIDAGPLKVTKSDAIKVDKDDVLTIVFTTSAGTFTSHKVDLEIAGLGIPVEDDPQDSDPTWTEVINVDDYSQYGVGLYKAKASGTLSDGSTCSGAVLFEIEGNPLTTVAGLSAVAVLILGILLTLLAALFTLNQFKGMRGRIETWGDEQLSRIRSGQTATPEGLAKSLREITRPPALVGIMMIAMLPLSLMMMGASMPGGVRGSIPAMGDVLRLPRLSFRPRVSVVGSIGGMLAIEALLVLFQQFAVTPLTGSNTIIGVLVGLTMAVLVTTLMRWWGGRGVNKKISEVESRLQEAIAQMRKEAGLPPASPDVPGPATP
jgi:hypothetical protein